MSHLSEEISVLDLRKKRSNQMPKLLRSRGRMELSIHEIVREKEMYSNFVFAPPPPNTMLQPQGTVRTVKMEQALKHACPGRKVVHT